MYIKTKNRPDFPPESLIESNTVVSKESHVMLTPVLDRDNNRVDVMSDFVTQFQGTKAGNKTDPLSFVNGRTETRPATTCHKYKVARPAFTQHRRQSPEITHVRC